MDQYGRDIYRLPPSYTWWLADNGGRVSHPACSFSTSTLSRSSRRATMPQRPPGCLMSLWLAVIGFFGGLFTKSPSAASLPIPVTTRSRNTPFAWPASGQSPLKRPSATASPISSSARTSSHACRSRSVTPKRPLADPVFHPPPSPFPNISLSGIFATPPNLVSSPDIEIGRFSFVSPTQVQTFTPTTPSPLRRSHGIPSPSFHSRSPSSAVIVQLDRSTISPTTMSDGSLQVISLGDPPASPVKVADTSRLPSPWSPTGKVASSDVWMSVEGFLTNSTGPIVHNSAQSESQDNSLDFSTVTLSPPWISTTALYSSCPALDAFGISVFVGLDKMGDQGKNVDIKDDSTSTLESNQLRDEPRPTLANKDFQTPRKRRDTLPSVTSHTKSQSARATKCLSTPLAKLDNVDIGHIRSATSFSSMAYELRMGLFADGRSITAFENIISLLDQVSPRSTTSHHDAVQPVAG
ncbi:hypothetical protein L210DRAFT_3204517 [Boletus edulis BED1]|uniref:Uncharacterized protein n=1 Tax=Boletus edulis BED1 TaxID=1328754 RepID=A0AAD4BX59_BOLED|nr:hypothetical protein L210DRAFT_3204517 [Boletus edulis BED1]